MKTLEFKIRPTVAQSQTIDLWLDQLKWVWNKGLELLEESQQRRWRNKNPVENDIDAVQWFWYRNEFEEDNKIEDSDKYGLACECSYYDRQKQEAYPICPLRNHREIEDIYKAFNSYHTHKANPPDHFIRGICTRVLNGMHRNLDRAWSQYLQGKKRRPKYKSNFYKKKVKTLVNENGKTTVKFTRIGNSNNAYVNFPILGKVVCKGFYKRFPLGNEHGKVTILKEASDYYLQVCVDIPEKLLPANDKAVGIDPGLKSVLTTDQGREVAPPKLYRNQQKKLKRLQRKASRQVRGSNSQKRTYKLISKLHEKIRRSRNAFNHKLSTKLVKEYGAITIENIPIKNLMRRPKPKKREDGLGYEHNGAKRKSGLNKSFADSALGDLIAKIESKAKASGREFVKVPAHYTTIDCSRCSAKIKKSLSTRTHRCTSCGYVAGRDENAAQNILIKGRELFDGVYRPWGWEVKWDEQASFTHEGMPPEAEQSAPGETITPQLPNKRGSGDVISPDVAQSTSSPFTSTVSSKNSLPSTRAPDTVSISANTQLSGDGRKKKRKRSAQSDDQTFVQLTLWDTAVPKGFEETG